ncbi:MAG TPA: hypothetical protein VHL31_14275 [Geminicoccus sp.]|jgi:hypothetical protein|uniref:hypothetical protein n=1 Tax=Geminicoccus sp. TaxID=2024832 RepID=UPI002E355459|nr:hypothetical protein [Geminicoccus sp.]HEX2527450.1 hypothetical protein [Geminicoccus sp.]
MSDVKITGLNMIRDGKPITSGAVYLASFNCEVRGFALFGCMLVKTPKNGFTANAPRIDGPDGRHRAVVVIDPALRHEVTMAAREIYRLMGGTEAEWVKQEPDNGSATQNIELKRKNM